MISKLLARSRTLTLAKARDILFLIWFVGVIPVFLLFAVLSFIHFGDAADQAWGWLVPLLSPTLGLIGASYLIDVTQSGTRDNRRIKRPSVFILAVVWSVVYLAAIVVMVFVEPRFPGEQPGDTWLTFYTRASLFFGAAQGILTALLGALFLSGGESGSES
jgi:hypothetical protein